MKVSLSDIFAQQAAESLAFARSKAGAEQAERNATAFRERETARRAWETVSANQGWTRQSKTDRLYWRVARAAA